MRRTILSLLLVLSPCLIAHHQADIGVKTHFMYFEGSWVGEESGKSGIGKGEREYQFILDDNFLFHKNTSVFEPQEKNPKGEIHQDWAFYSYDRMRGKYIMREFHSEGFVNQYVLDSLSTDNKTMIFVSEAIENISEGWRARQTIEIQNDDEFLETFELAGPGKDFSVFLENRWTRVKE